MVFVTVEQEGGRHVLDMEAKAGYAVLRQDRYSKLPEKIEVSRYILLLALYELRKTNKIIAIRVIRDALSLGIKEAKDFIEGLDGYVSNDDRTAYMDCPRCKEALETLWPK